VVTTVRRTGAGFAARVAAGAGAGDTEGAAVTVRVCVRPLLPAGTVT
jgi:hypothetical protein